MIVLDRVGKYYGSQDVLTDISLEIAAGEKIGLIGPNGSGKTSLIRMLIGAEEQSAGRVTREKSTVIGYVPQYVRFEEHQTARDVLLTDFNRIETALKSEEEALASTTGQKELENALARYQKARDAFDTIGGYEHPQRAETLLDSLCLAGTLDQEVASLSGGERNVLSFAQALLGRPNLLVLDEPGNHLDYLGLAWLEKYLARYPEALLIVSHNRYLLDRVANRIYELEGGRLTAYAGDYSAYRLAKLRQLVAQQADYAANCKRLDQLEALVKRFAEITRNTSDPAWGKRLRARRSQLERERRQAVDKPVLHQARISLDMQVADARADVALQVKAYSKSFGSNVLFENGSFEIACGDRVALVGSNGSGKTTFLKDVVEHASWDDDCLRVGPSLSIGYCAQNQEVFSPQATILEEFLSLRPGTKADVLSVLSRFLFAWEDLDKPISALSGGEKNRLQLARLSMLETSFLILDEPTNHMDIPSKEAIEESLSGFKGTILVVSHDRYFLDRITDYIMEIRDHGFYPFDGSFSEYWSAREILSDQQDGRVATRARPRKQAASQGNTGGRAIPTARSRASPPSRRKSSQRKPSWPRRSLPANTSRPGS